MLIPFYQSIARAEVRAARVSYEMSVGVFLYFWSLEKYHSEVSNASFQEC